MMMPEQLQHASLQILIQHFHQFKSKRIQTTNSAGTAAHAITADVLAYYHCYISIISTFITAIIL